jgi:hypothetical protein
MNGDVHSTISARAWRWFSSLRAFWKLSVLELLFYAGLAGLALVRLLSEWFA